MNVRVSQAQGLRGEGLCPSPLLQRIGARRPGEEPLDIFPERCWELPPRNSGRRRPGGWHGDTAQASALLDRVQGFPRPGNGCRQEVKLSGQGRPAEFGDEAVDRAVVDRLWPDPAQARPPGETRKAMPNLPVGRRKNAAPSPIQVEV